MQGSWFISHNSGDKDLARAISVLLLSQGLRPWLDEWEIRPGDEIVHAVDVGLDQAEGVVVLWSANALSSNWVRRELSAAVHRGINSGGTFRVVPVILDATPLPPLLAGIAFVDWRDEALRVPNLLRGVGNVDGDRRSMLRGVVHLLDELGIEPKGMYGLLACPECGSERLKDAYSEDERRGDMHGDTTCEECGWFTGGEV